MKMTASGFVHAAVKDSVQAIVDNKQCCELNPRMLENPGDAVTNAQHLLDILSIVIEDVFSSTDKCPEVLRYISACLQNSASVKWEDENVRTRVVGGFIFLRLLCPAIINPRMFNLITETPSDIAPNKRSSKGGVHSRSQLKTFRGLPGKTSSTSGTVSVANAIRGIWQPPANSGLSRRR